MSLAFILEADGEGAEAALLWELGCTGIEQRGSSLVAYFPRKVGLPLEGSWQELEEEDYLANYQKSLGPVRVGCLVVAPTHAEPVLLAPERVLWLDPGMAFGSGHHETTLLALEALTEADPWDLRVLDVGAGSGILAIAAALLGASEALGIDNDAATVPIAGANARVNRASARFREGTLESVATGAPFDIIVANLYAELHRELLPAYEARLVQGGRLFLTGILIGQRDRVLAALPPGLVPVGEQTRGEWLLLALKREKGAG